jgi:transcriptional regulator with XRE-family HTH domain
MNGAIMTGRHVLARMLRAFSRKTQAEVAEDLDCTPQLVNQWERGKALPSEEDLQRMAVRCAEITPEDAEELQAVYETRHKAFRRRGAGADALVDDLAEKLTRFCADVAQRLLELPPSPARQPSPEDRQEAERQFAELARLRERPRLAVVKLTPRYQNWALLEKCCAVAVQETSGNLARAAAWARLALAIAKWLPGSEPWQNRNRGYALAHWAKILEAQGKASLAKICEEQAARLWLAGADPAGLLDSCQLPSLGLSSEGVGTPGPILI